MAGAPPSYQYYPGDFAIATCFMTLEEVGAYQRLLNAQWEHGHIPDSIPKMAMAIGTTPEKMEELWNTLEDKFPEVDDGRRANPRMEEIREKRAKFVEQQREKALKRWGSDPDDGDDPEEDEESPATDPLSILRGLARDQADRIEGDDEREKFLTLVEETSEGPPIYEAFLELTGETLET